MNSSFTCPRPVLFSTAKVYKSMKIFTPNGLILKVNKVNLHFPYHQVYLVQHFPYHQGTQYYPQTANFNNSVLLCRQQIHFQQKGKSWTGLTGSLFPAIFRNINLREIIIVVEQFLSKYCETLYFRVPFIFTSFVFALLT